MKTLIDHNGCATYPYGSPALEVTVPTTLQGVDVLAVIKALTERVTELELKLSTLTAPQNSVQNAPVSSVEAAKVSVASVPVESVSEPVEAVLEAPATDVVVESAMVEVPVTKQTKKSSK